MNELISKWIKQIQRTQKSDQAPGNLHLNHETVSETGCKIKMINYNFHGWNVKLRW